jgi:hypothetical protein
MVSFKIPFFDAEVDTSDPSESASNIGGAVLGGTLLFGVMAAASYVYSRFTEISGVDPETNIPGV